MSCPGSALGAGPLEVTRNAANVFFFADAARRPALPLPVPLRCAASGTERTRTAAAATVRIWAIEQSRVAAIVGGLLSRDDVAALLAPHGWADVEADEPTLWAQLLGACSQRCRLAEDIERLLHVRTAPLETLVRDAPMIAVAQRWSDARDERRGSEVAGLLWRLACDPRHHLEKLASRVAADLCIRAMQLVRGQRVVVRSSREAPWGEAAF